MSQPTWETSAAPRATIVLLGLVVDARGERVKRVVWSVYSVVVVVHGLIHLMGVAEGFGLADVEQLTEPVSGGEAVLWLVAAVAVIGAAAMTVARARGWWVVTAVAAVVSQVAILTSWTDARAGTAANVLMLVAAAYGFATRGSPEGSRP